MRASPPMNGILVVAGGTYSFIAIVLPLSLPLPLPPSLPLHSSSVGETLGTKTGRSTVFAWPFTRSVVLSCSVLSLEQRAQFVVIIQVE